VWSGAILEFHPFFSSDVKYTDNLFHRRSDIRSDWITTISPGFSTHLNHPRATLQLEYQPGWVYFLHHPELDYLSHNLNLNTLIKLTPRLTFSLKENFITTNSPSSSEMEDTDYERSQTTRGRAEYDRNTFSPALEYRFGIENFARLYYRNSTRTGDTSDSNDYTENFFEGKLEYWFDASNAINLQCRFTKADFDRDADILSNAGVAATYIHRFTHHFQLSAGYGAGAIDFEGTPLYRSLTGGRRYQVGVEDVEDYDMHRFNTGFAWQLPKNFRIEGNIGYYWRQGVGNRDDQGLTSQVEIEKATRNLTMSLAWESGFAASYFAVSDSGFQEFWRLKTNLTYNFHEKWDFTCTGFYGFKEYKEGRGAGSDIGPKREDYRYEAKASFAYHILRKYGLLHDLSFKIDYRHIEVDSTRERDYYINNEFTFKLTATF
jgi:hypothetical protein